MIFRVALILLCLFGYNLNAQIKNFTAGKDTIKPNLKLFDIKIEEIDSQKISLDSNLSPYSDSSYFRGNLVQAFRGLLNTEFAYMKISGNVPDKYIQYHIYLNYEHKSHPNYFTGTSPYKETIMTALQSYYKCKIRKVKEMTEVYVIYKVDTNKLKPGNPNLEEGNIFYDMELSNENMGLSFLLTNYTKKIITIDENSLDDHKYMIKLDKNEESTIEGLEKGLLKNGLKLVKEQRLFEFYLIDFENSRF